LSTKGKVLTKQVVDFDATSAVTGDGTYNFALVSSSTDWVTYQTREATTGKPQLVLTLTQNTAPVVNIAAPAPNATVNIGSPVTFSGKATDAESGDLSGQIQWTSNLDGALGTGASITVARLQPGTHTITARVTDATGLSGRAQITLQVGHKPSVAIAMPQNHNASAAADRDVVLTAAASDDFDGDISSQVQWTSSRQGALCVGASKAVRLREGQHTITASVTDSDGATSTAQITVIITPTPPALTITSPADGGTVTQDASTSFTATALDATDGDLSSTMRWTSDRDGVLASGASFATNMLSEGTHHITVTATDSGGLMGSAGITLNVIRVPAVTVLLPQVNDGFLSGNAVTFYATATDRI